MKPFQEVCKESQVLGHTAGHTAVLSKPAYLFLLLVLLPCLLSLPVLTAAKEPAGTAKQDTAPLIDPMADRLLQRMSKLLGSSPQLSVHVEINYDLVLKGGAVMEMSKHSDVMVKRPHRMWAQIVDDLGERRFWYNGKAVTLQGMANNVYAVKEISGTIDDVVDRIHEKLGIQTPIADFLVSDPYGDLKKNVTWARYAGLHYLDGDFYHHLILGNDNVQGQLWLEDSPRGLPKRLSITSLLVAGMPRYAADFSDRDFTQDMSDAMFEFQPPPGAERIEFLPPSHNQLSEEVAGNE